MDNLVASRREGEDSTDLMHRFQTVMGFTSAQDGKTYVFLDNHSSPYSLLQTVQHEGFHEGLLSAFLGDRKQVEAFIQELTDGRNGFPAWVSENAKKLKNPREVEEFLAALAETMNAGPGFFHSVNRAMRRAMALNSNAAPSEMDVNNIIYGAWKAQRMTPDMMPKPREASGSFAKVSGINGPVEDMGGAVDQKFGPAISREDTDRAILERDRAVAKKAGEKGEGKKPEKQEKKEKPAEDKPEEKGEEEAPTEEKPKADDGDVKPDLEEDEGETVTSFDDEPEGKPEEKQEGEPKEEPKEDPNKEPTGERKTAILRRANELLKKRRALFNPKTLNLKPGNEAALEEVDREIAEFSKREHLTVVDPTEQPYDEGNIYKVVAFETKKDLDKDVTGDIYGETLSPAVYWEDPETRRNVILQTGEVVVWQYPRHDGHDTIDVPPPKAPGKKPRKGQVTSTDELQPEEEEKPTEASEPSKTEPEAKPEPKPEPVANGTVRNGRIAWDGKWLKPGGIRGHQGVFISDTEDGEPLAFFQTENWGLGDKETRPMRRGTPVADHYTAAAKWKAAGMPGLEESKAQLPVEDVDGAVSEDGYIRWEKFWLKPGTHNGEEGYFIHDERGGQAKGFYKPGAWRTKAGKERPGKVTNFVDDKLTGERVSAAYRWSKHEKMLEEQAKKQAPQPEQTQNAPTPQQPEREAQELQEATTPTPQPEQATEPETTQEAPTLKVLKEDEDGRSVHVSTKGITNTKSSGRFFEEMAAVKDAAVRAGLAPQDAITVGVDTNGAVVAFDEDAETLEKVAPTYMPVTMVVGRETHQVYAVKWSDPETVVAVKDFFDKHTVITVDRLNNAAKITKPNTKRFSAPERYKEALEEIPGVKVYLDGKGLPSDVPFPKGFYTKPKGGISHTSDGTNVKSFAHGGKFYVAIPALFATDNERYPEKNLGRGMVVEMPDDIRFLLDANRQISIHLDKASQESFGNTWAYPLSREADDAIARRRSQLRDEKKAPSVQATSNQQVSNKPQETKPTTPATPSATSPARVPQTREEANNFLRDHIAIVQVSGDTETVTHPTVETLGKRPSEAKTPENRPAKPRKTTAATQELQEVEDLLGGLGMLREGALPPKDENRLGRQIRSRQETSHTAASPEQNLATTPSTNRDDVHIVSNHLTGLEEKVAVLAGQTHKNCNGVKMLR